ncbi:hypothetical protein PSTG_05526 [Puccinia striiformis f. sp. tritici PST-78]|uniref:Uncharacterized protein n=1 Tax=Puccinia striiformis f. sp. tritici PST-78 TaxID=1165861 RepID=A0A0L0VPN9_9BASI|nr:hypothetical protein PSTG_05526 [Puccinia striiformis f. sp. tritici PST-78]
MGDFGHQGEWSCTLVEGHSFRAIEGYIDRSSLAPGTSRSENEGRFEKGKKRESVSAFNEDPASKRRANESETLGMGSGDHVLANDALESSNQLLGDMYFNKGISDLMYDDS